MTAQPSQAALDAAKGTEWDRRRAAAQAMLDDIGNGDKLDLADPYRRLITVQLSSADLIGMADAAIAAHDRFAASRLAEAEEKHRASMDHARRDLVEQSERYEELVTKLAEAEKVVAAAERWLDGDGFPARKALKDALASYRSTGERDG